MSTDKTERLVIVGDSAFADIAYQYFTYDSPYEVVAFAVEKEYMSKDEFNGLPVVEFADLESSYPPVDCKLFVALTYGKLNRTRTRLYQQAKRRGYQFASYISSHCFVWRNVEYGENCFVFENNTLQPFVTLGDNVILWSGNHIGHHSKIASHTFISSHVVISGFCEIGESCFFGVNSTVADTVKVGSDCFVNSGAVVMKNLSSNTIFNPEKSKPFQKRTAKELFKVPEQE